MIATLCISKYIFIYIRAHKPYNIAIVFFFGFMYIGKRTSENYRRGKKCLHRPFFSIAWAFWLGIKIFFFVFPPHFLVHRTNDKKRNEEKNCIKKDLQIRLKVIREKIYGFRKKIAEDHKDKIDSVFGPFLKMRERKKKSRKNAKLTIRVRR